MKYALAFDIGSTNVKTGLFDSESLQLLASHVAHYPLYVDGAYAENRVEDWWQAMRQGVAHVLRAAGKPTRDIEAITFCAQMQGVVLVDPEGKALRNSINYLDARAEATFDRRMRTGLFRIEGLNAAKILRAVAATNGAPATPKDPIWKLLWVKENEPELFSMAHKWIDVKDYLIARCTGRICTTPDSAHLTFLYDFKGDGRWNPGLCALFGVPQHVLPEVVAGDSIAGALRPLQARELGLPPGIPVVAGGGDATCIALGSGCVGPGEVNIYIGTSAWVSLNTARRAFDTARFMATIRGAVPGTNKYIGELQTGGICLQWAHRTFLQKPTSQPAPADDVFGDLTTLLQESEPGADGILFAPWLQGSRSPNPDIHARGIYVNLSLNSQARDIVRATYEGVAYHLKWIAQGISSRFALPQRLYLAGGGANSRPWAQMLADIIERTLIVPAEPQYVGVRGAAILALIATGRCGTLAEAAAKVTAQAEVFAPSPERQAIYRRQYEAFVRLYRANRKVFGILARRAAEPARELEVPLLGVTRGQVESASIHSSSL